MRNTLLTLVAAAAFSAWSLAFAGAAPTAAPAAAQSNPAAPNVQITNGPTVQNVTGNSATLVWTTNVGSSAIVHYGTDPNNLNQTAQAPWSEGYHQVMLQNLQPNATYYYQVESTQAQGTGTGVMGPVLQFRTPASSASGAYGSNTYYGTSSAANQQEQPAQIVQGPVVEYVSSNSAVVAWSTNVPSSSVLRYGTDPNNLTQTAQAPWGQTTHRVTLSNLQPNATYYFQVQSGQAQGTGTGAMSSIASFQTTAPGAPAKNYPPIR